MSQRGVERILGKLVTDRGFREGFFQDPSKAVPHIGVDLSPEEIDALSRIPPQALDDLYRKVDDRICRLHIDREVLGQGERQ